MQTCTCRHAITLAPAMLPSDTMTIAYTKTPVVYMHLAYTSTGAYFLSNSLHSNERKYISWTTITNYRRQWHCCTESTNAAYVTTDTQDSTTIYRQCLIIFGGSNWALGQWSGWGLAVTCCVSLCYGQVWRHWMITRLGQWIITS